MIATTKIKMDLADPKRQPAVEVMQDDRYSREVEIGLYTGGIPFCPPQDCTALVRCRKGDGTVAVYDTLPDGSSATAIAGNKVTVRLAPQLCMVPGRAELTVNLFSGGAQLSSFAVALYVRAQPQGKREKEDYISVTGFLPQPEAAQAGQYLKVAAVENGKVTRLSTAPVYAGGAGASDVPAYVQREARRVASAAQERQNADTVTMLLCSDAHYSAAHPNGDLLGQSVAHCGQAMALIRKRIHVDITAMLGDLIWDSGETPRQAQDAMGFVHEMLGDGPWLYARGNHDCLPSHAQGLSDSQVFANVGIHNTGVVFDSQNKLGGYCYRDLPDHKLRVVCLNTAEAADGSFAVSERQIAWLQEVLDLSALGEGWGSILLSHHPLDWYGSAQPVVQTVAAAQGVLCNIHGHVHGFLADWIAGTRILRIAIPNICFYRSNEYGENGRPENSEGIEFGESVTYPKVAGSAQDTAFCLVTVDRGSGKVYADHYGAGYSRVVSLEDATVESYGISVDASHIACSQVPERINHGAAFALWLEAESGYAIQTVTVSMGGVDVTGEAYDAGLVSIGAVTGDVVVTAKVKAVSGGTAGGDGENSGTDSGDDSGSAVEDNLVPSSVDTDGSVYNGTGYRFGYRIGSSGDLKELSGAVVSGYVPYNAQTVCVGGSAASTVGTLGNYIALYDSDFSLIVVLGFDNLESYGAVWAAKDGKYALTIQPEALTNSVAAGYFASAAYIRCSLGKVNAGSDLYLTLDGAGSTGGDSGDSGDSGDTGDNTDGESGSYTNLVLSSTDESGNLFNGTGYQSGYRLNSSGTTTALTGAVTSGNIPYNGGVIRIYGASDGTVGISGNYLALNDSAYGRINTVDFANLVNYGAAWSQVGQRYMLTVDPGAVSNATFSAQLASAAYIRCSLGKVAAAEEFVVTLDEEITVN